jgi:rhodanese-related sulfurtransferase
LAGFDFQFPKDHLVVIVGEGETVSQNNELAAFFKKRGYEKINFLSGGFSGWKDSGSQAVSWGDPYSFIDSAKVTYIEPDELKKFLDEQNPIFILDVRGNSDFSSRRVPGAANIALENLEKERSKIPSNRIIIAYGSTELEGFRAGVKLYDLNFYSALVLRGGFSSWMEKGYPVEISNN